MPSTTGYLMIRSVPLQTRRDWAAEASRRGIKQGALVAVAVAVALLKQQEVAS